MANSAGACPASELPSQNGSSDQHTASHIESFQWQDFLTVTFQGWTIARVCFFHRISYARDVMRLEQMQCASADGSNVSDARTRTIAAAGFLWLTAVTGGLAWMTCYEYAPGVVGVIPSAFPSTAGVVRVPRQFSLVMLVHPRCPCSRASIGELEKIMARCQGRVHAQVLCYKPDGAADDWAQTDLWRSAAAIPGVCVVADEAGREAARFGGEVSGQTALFDDTGRLLFHGGITSGRGHAGDNAGSDAVLALVNGATQRASTHVFGCPIRGGFVLPASAKEP